MLFYEQQYPIHLGVANLPTHPRIQLMIIVCFLRHFCQKDRRISLQRAVASGRNNNSVTEEIERKYQRIIQIADSIKYKRVLSFEEAKFAAAYFRSLKNELDGKTLRFHSNVNQKINE